LITLSIYSIGRTQQFAANAKAQRKSAHIKSLHPCGVALIILNMLLDTWNDASPIAERLEWSHNTNGADQPNGCLI